MFQLAVNLSRRPIVSTVVQESAAPAALDMMSINQSLAKIPGWGCVRFALIDPVLF